MTRQQCDLVHDCASTAGPILYCYRGYRGQKHTGAICPVSVFLAAPFERCNKIYEPIDVDIGRIRMNSPLRVGIHLNGYVIPRWQHSILERLILCGYASINLIILPDPRIPVGQGQGRPFLVNALQQHEARKHRLSPDACELLDIRQMWTAVDVIHLPIRSSIGTVEPTSSFSAKLVACGLDVILGLGDVTWLDTLAHFARYGIWFLDHPEYPSNLADGTSIGLMEVLNRKPYIHGRLIIRRRDNRSDVVAYQSWSGVHQRSHLRSQNEHLCKIQSFFPRTLNRLAQVGEEEFFNQLTDRALPQPVTVTGTCAALRDTRVFRALVSHLLWRLTQKFLNRFFVERWILMYSLEADAWDLSKYRKLIPPNGRFWADPCVLQRDGGYYIFFEDAAVKTGKGRISVIGMDDNGKCSEATVVLERRYHLSYPFVFEWQGHLYMIPESAENQTIELYGCDQFPDKWSFQKNLMTGIHAYDATLVEHAGRWWLFANVREHEGASSWDELYLYHADSPLSDNWQPHPLNPVVSDVRNARPAGRVFTENGRLYRPSQNSSYRYGYGININEISELSVTAYREHPVRSYTPKHKGPILAMHTHSHAGTVTVIDAIYRVRR